MMMMMMVVDLCRGVPRDRERATRGAEWRELGRRRVTNASPLIEPFKNEWIPSCQLSQTMESS